CQDHARALRDGGHLNARLPAGAKHNNELAAIYNAIVREGNNANTQLVRGTYWSGTLLPGRPEMVPTIQILESGHMQQSHYQLISVAMGRCVRDEPNLTLVQPL